MLLVLPDILNADELTQAHDWLAHVSWQDGRDTAGSQAKQVKNNQQLSATDTATHAIARMVMAGLQRNPMYFSAVLPLRVVPPRVNRYGGHANAYGAHIDSAVRLLPDGQHVRTDVSCTVFLNDPNEYDGGELCVTQPGDMRCVKLPAGHAVIYPATYVHEVKPVTRGHRLACFFWIESLVRSDEQRRLLFELDTALVALRQQGETDETVKLTGVYHNLLRMWAHT